MYGAAAIAPDAISPPDVYGAEKPVEAIAGATP